MVNRVGSEVGPGVIATWVTGVIATGITGVNDEVNVMRFKWKRECISNRLYPLTGKDPS